MTEQEILERRGVALALAALPEIGPVRLRNLLGAGHPVEVWDQVCRGIPVLDGLSAEVPRLWKTASSKLHPPVELERHLDAGYGVCVLGDSEMPAAFHADRAAPALLVYRGDLSAAAVPLVSVVGTRRATHTGRAVAFELGADLAAVGIGVCSGLALGIDGAAHEGSLSVDGAAPVAVVAGGLDQVYPRRHAALWGRVADRGVIMSEWPLGIEPVRWRFPARNRLIAALGSLLVVVESGTAGGSMHTVRQADDRGRLVMAVPGSVRSAAAAGTNLLISEGCPPCRDVDDVLVALGMERMCVPSKEVGRPAVSLSEDAGELLLGITEATTINALCAATSWSVSRVATALEELAESRAVVHLGGVIERVS